MATVDEVWDRIHAWCEINAPVFLGLLRPGASEEQIEKLEKRLGVDLPEDLKASYRIHDGSEAGCFFPDVSVGCTLHAIEEILADWEVTKGVLEQENFNEVGVQEERAPDKIRDAWWDPGWIPFGSDGCGNAVCVDLAPGETGTHGQVIEYIHDLWENTWHAASFLEFLKGFADDLENGKYVLTEDKESLNLKE